MSTSKSLQYDVVISGGGLSGLLMAAGLLQETKLNIAIIEPTNTQDSSERERFDDRCLALSFGSVQLLKLWQVWPHLSHSQNAAPWPIETIVTSDRGHIGKTIMRANDFAVNAMGCVAAMSALGKALERTVGDKAITWYRPDNIADLAQQTDCVTITLASGQVLTSKLLVVAEGGNSPTRKRLNIESRFSAYPQAAIIANVSVSHPNSKGSRKLPNANADTTAFERFTQHGPIAFLPIGKGQYSVVWSVEPNSVEAIMAMNDDQFCAALQHAFGWSAGQIVGTTERSSYPLSLTLAERLVSHRVALVGNSGHAIHPIAGQGFNLGIRDIAQLVALITSSLAVQKDIGAFDLLHDYQTLRQRDIERISGFTDSLVKLFALPGRPAAFARTVGLTAMDQCTGLQTWLAMQFMSKQQHDKTTNQYLHGVR